MSSIKSKIDNNSPKTPGGISKSLLTPCRRVGLSRKWGKRGPSPFISPLSNGRTNSANIKLEKEVKKRKRSTSDEESDSIHDSTNIISTPPSTACDTSNNINNTPIRNITSLKKKSKTLLMKETKESQKTNINEDVKSKVEESACENSEIIIDKPVVKQSTPLSKLSRTISKRELNHKKLINTEDSLKNDSEIKENKDNIVKCEKSVKEKSPNNLAKECVVVIQKKMIKGFNLHTDKQDINMTCSTSQTLFDSDSDDTPLCALSKKEHIKTDKDFDDDFTDNKVIKLQNKNTSTTDLKTSKTKKKATKNLKPKTIEIHTSQNSFEDDDDFECFNKRTILVKKSYDKVIKPSKAKSTGSITQKDIDELKARIEMKKNLLVAKAITEDTEELRNLIKKWQKGCQEALSELFDLMRSKFPDKKNMDYGEILQTLKIPPDLVGYDVDNDCFVTPDDKTIILSSINT